MDAYVIASALWGNCGNMGLARIGLISHELGHFLGLADLYDASTKDQRGVCSGLYDLMSDTWGLDFTQHYPPLMSPWTKTQLGWLTPTVMAVPSGA